MVEYVNWGSLHKVLLGGSIKDVTNDWETFQN